MTLLKYLLLGVEVLVAVLLIGIILIQRSKEQGLGLAFGSGMGEAIFGAEAGNVLTKATVILAIVFMINTIALAKMFSAAPRYGSVMSNVEGPPPTAAPPGGGAMPPAAMPPATEMPPAETPPAEAPGDASSVPVAPMTTPMPESTTVPETPAAVPAE